MQFKTVLIAFGLAAATTGAAIPEPNENLQRTVSSAPFKIRRFTPLANFNPLTEGTWSNNQYTNIATANQIFNYKDVGSDEAYFWTINADGVLRGSSTNGGGGLVPRNLQSYEITVTPVAFGGIGDPVKVTIGPAPLFEVKFQTVRDGNPVSQWTAFSQIGGYIFLGKASDISSPIRFRAIGYTPLV